MGAPGTAVSRVSRSIELDGEMDPADPRTGLLTRAQGTGEPPPMLLRLHRTERAADLAPLEALAAELGYGCRLLDQGRRIAELTRPQGDAGSAGDRSRFEDLSCVQAVLDASDAPEHTERTPDRPESAVRIRDAVFGAGHVSLIAGPCAVERREDVLEIARAVRAAGARVLRGGAFKPRTSPYSFQGLGRAGLEQLAEVRAETGLGIVTEVLDPRDVGTVAGVADALQLGSRSMSNAALLREAGASGKPVLLKRGLAATVREFLLAAEHVLEAGNPHVILCERGIRSFDTVTRNVLDVGAVAHLKRATHLPVIVDPSHAAGRAELVEPLARAGLAAGADGLIVEVHPRPAGVHSDGAQAISPAAFARIAESASILASLDGKILEGAAEPPGFTAVRPQDDEPGTAATPRPLTAKESTP